MGGQFRQPVDVLGVEQLAAHRQGLYLEGVVLLGEVFQQTGGGARVLLRERQYGGAFQHILNAFELGVGDGAPQQRVAHHPQIHLALSGVPAQRRHVVHRHAAVIGEHGGHGADRGLIDLGYDLTLVFQSNRHGPGPPMRIDQSARPAPWWRTAPPCGYRPRGRRPAWPS